RVVAPDVLGEEVLVEDGAEQRAAEQLHVLPRAVDQLVPDDDPRVRRGDAHQEACDRHVQPPDATERDHPNQKVDVDELEPYEDIEHAVEGPPRKGQWGLTSFGVAAHVRDDVRYQDQEPGERQVPGMRCGGEERQYGQRQNEAEQMLLPQSHLPREGGEVALGCCTSDHRSGPLPSRSSWETAKPVPVPKLARRRSMPSFGRGPS